MNNNIEHHEHTISAVLREYTKQASVVPYKISEVVWALYQHILMNVLFCFWFLLPYIVRSSAAALLKCRTHARQQRRGSENIFIIYIAKSIIFYNTTLCVKDVIMVRKGLVKSFLCLLRTLLRCIWKIYISAGIKVSRGQFYEKERSLYNHLHLISIDNGW